MQGVPRQQSFEQAPGRPRRDTFRFVEKEKQGMTEREITSVDQPPKFEIDAFVKKFLYLSRERQTGTSRVEDAAFQNTIARAILSGVIENSTRFSSEFSAGIAKALTGKSTEIVVAGAKMEAGVYWRKLWEGITAIVGDVRDMRREFAQSTRPADLRQMIGMNDLLDASKKIDLVDIRYQPRGEGIDVREVRLVQVKRGGQPLASYEVSGIFREHEAYVASLAGREALSEHMQRAQTTEFVVSGQAFAAELETRKESDRDVRAFLHEYFGEFLLNLLVEPSLDARVVDRVWTATAGTRSGTIAKLFFAHPGASEFIALSADRAGESAAAAQRLVTALRTWALLYPPSRADLSALNPDWKLDPTFLETATFVSVIREGGKETVKPIEVAHGKSMRTLTGS